MLGRKATPKSAMNNLASEVRMRTNRKPWIWQSAFIIWSPLVMECYHQVLDSLWISPKELPRDSNWGELKKEGYEFTDSINGSHCDRWGERLWSRIQRSFNVWRRTQLVVP